MPSTLHAQGKAPHIVAACAANAIAGTIQLISGDLPESVFSSMPYYMDTLWSALLVLGGVTALFGIYIKDPILGLRLEGAGHVGVVGGCLVYAIALVTWISVPWWPQLSVWWAVSLSTASAVRWFQIVRTTHKARRQAEGAK